MIGSGCFENLSIALLAWTHDGAPSPWASVAAVFTLLKSGLILATLAAAVGGAIRWLWIVRRESGWNVLRRGL